MKTAASITGCIAALILVGLAIKIVVEWPPVTGDVLKAFLLFLMAVAFLLTGWRLPKSNIAILVLTCEGALVGWVLHGLVLFALIGETGKKIDLETGSYVLLVVAASATIILRVMVWRMSSVR